MNETKHTPGPFRIAQFDTGHGKEHNRENNGAFIIMAGTPGEDSYTRVGTADLMVHAKRGQGYKTADPVALANAHLFAAAPALLAAASEALDWMAKAGYDDGVAGHTLRLAIALATGSAAKGGAK